MSEKFDEKQDFPKQDFEKKEILEKLAKSQSTKERVKLFGKIMDTYGVDPIVSLIPELGDAGVGIVATTYLLAEGKRMGLKFGDMLKIIGYQSTDLLVGAIPVLGDIADFFFKANKRSAKIFEKHFEKLKQEALAKGVDPSDIAKIETKNKKFLDAIHNHLDSKKKSK